MQEGGAVRGVEGVAGGHVVGMGGPYRFVGQKSGTGGETTLSLLGNGHSDLWTDGQ